MKLSPSVTIILNIIKDLFSKYVLHKEMLMQIISIILLKLLWACFLAHAILSLMLRSLFCCRYKWWSHWLHPGGGCGYGNLPVFQDFARWSISMIMGTLCSLLGGEWSWNFVLSESLVILSFLLNVDPVLQVCPHWCSAVGNRPLPWPAGSTPPAGWGPVSHPSYKGTLLLLFSLVSHRSLELSSADYIWQCC